MSRKRRGAQRQGLHVVLERSTIAIVGVCFLLFNVVVFSAGYVSGVSAAREPEARQAPQPVRPIATPIQEVAAQAARRAADTTAFVTTSQFAFMSLPDLYRALVRQGGTVDDVLSSEVDTGVPGGSTAEVEEESVESTFDSRRYAVQLGAFEAVASARDAQEIVQMLGYEPEVVRSVTPSGDAVYLLILSRHRSLSEADAAANAYRSATGNDAVAVPYRRSASYRDAHR